jgi:hypothetical protein
VRIGDWTDEPQTPKFRDYLEMEAKKAAGIAWANAKEMVEACTDANKGLRYDTGKVRMDLMPPEWDLELGKILTAGANKYEPRNWEKGMDYSKVLGPLMRHLNKWRRGEELDITDDSGQPGTGCHHLALVAWNALALMSFEMRGIGTDDLARQDCTEKV